LLAIASTATTTEGGGFGPPEADWCMIYGYHRSVTSGRFLKFQFFINRKDRTCPFGKGRIEIHETAEIALVPSGKAAKRFMKP